MSYDRHDRYKHHGVKSNRRSTLDTRYKWSYNDQLLNVADDIAKTAINYQYDKSCTLIGLTNQDGVEILRNMDSVGNIYKSKDTTEEIYGSGGCLLENHLSKFSYDIDGNLSEKCDKNGDTWQYAWTSAGTLQSITSPDSSVVSFEYDALGRRTTKIVDDIVYRYLWSGNTVIHEWSYALADRAGMAENRVGIGSEFGVEPVLNLVTWVFEDGRYTPCAKITDDNVYSIITNHLAVPIQAYDGGGEIVWERELDIYGVVTKEQGLTNFVPFMFPGQYLDGETGLCYNRFRYYSPETGAYISKDPIGLKGNNPTLYGYVFDPNKQTDLLGLKCKGSYTVAQPDRFNFTGPGELTIHAYPDYSPKPGHCYITVETDYMKEDIGQHPNDTSTMLDCLVGTGGSLECDDTCYSGLNDKRPLRSRTRILSAEEMSSLNIYMNKFHAKNEKHPNNGYNLLRGRQCVNFAYGAAKVSGDPLIKVRGVKTPEKLAQAIDKANYLDPEMNSAPKSYEERRAKKKERTIYDKQVRKELKAEKEELAKVNRTIIESHRALKKEQDKQAKLEAKQNKKVHKKQAELNKKADKERKKMAKLANKTK